MSEKTAESWMFLAVRVSPEAVEATSSYLLEVSPAGIEQLDASHPDPPSDLPGELVEIRAFLPPGSDPRAQEEACMRFLRRQERLMPGLAYQAPRTVSLKPEDWADGWRKHFRPVRCGRFFIHPGWVQPDAHEACPVRIDPSLAFGTGLHPTTQLCLQEMDRVLPVSSFLDVGSGSGILALAAARSGVPLVIGVDHDPQACRVALQNLANNELQGRVTFIEGQVDRITQRFSLVAANILSETLIGMAPALSRRLAPGGTLLLAGILAEEAADTLAAYRACGCRYTLTRESGDWSLIRMTAPDWGATA